MADTERKAWKDVPEVNAFKPQLLQKLRAAAWRRGNPSFDEYRNGMEDSTTAADKAFKLLQRGRHSAGQAGLLRCQIREAELKLLKVKCDAELLEDLDRLGIEREWKNNEGHEADPRLLFHFRMATPQPNGDKKNNELAGWSKDGGLFTLDLTDEFEE